MDPNSPTPTSSEIWFWKEESQDLQDLKIRAMLPHPQVFTRGCPSPPTTSCSTVFVEQMSPCQQPPFCTSCFSAQVSAFCPRELGIRMQQAWSLCVPSLHNSKTPNKRQVAGFPQGIKRRTPSPRRLSLAAQWAAYGWVGLRLLVQ